MGGRMIMEWNAPVPPLSPLKEEIIKRSKKSRHDF